MLFLYGFLLLDGLHFWVGLVFSKGIKMFFCIGENDGGEHAVGEGETIEKAISNWSMSRDNWGGIIQEFKRYDPVIIQGLQLSIELKCPPPIVKIL